MKSSGTASVFALYSLALLACREEGLLEMSRRHLEEWRLKVEGWEKKYGKADQLDLSSVIARRPCQKCGKSTGKLHRHHTGNDLMWAAIHEKEFAPRYIQFHPDDIVILCQRCHNRIHRRYERLLIPFMIDWFGAGDNPPVEVCRYWQEECRKECARWLEKKRRRRGRSRKKSTSGRQGKSSKKK